MNNIIINTTNGSLPRCPPEIGDAWRRSGKAPGKLRWPTTDSRLRTKVRMKIMRRGVRCWLVSDCDNIGKVMKLIFSLSCAGERNTVSCVPRWSLNDGDDCPMIAP